MNTRVLDNLAVLCICTTEIMENCRSRARLMMKMAIGDCSGAGRPLAETGVTAI